MKSYRTLALKELLSQKVTSILILIAVVLSTINLTSKEFDILALLIANPKRVFTYELITDLVWKEDCDFYSRKAIHNHISKLRKKLRFEPDLPNYIESVAGIGYKFEHL